MSGVVVYLVVGALFMFYVFVRAWHSAENEFDLSLAAFAGGLFLVLMFELGTCLGEVN